MNLNLKTVYQILKDTVNAWIDSRSPRLGAALAYYTIFAIAPLFLLILRISAAWFGKDAAQHQLFGQLDQLLGAEGAKAIESMINSAASQPQTGAWATALAIGTLAVAASAVFVELQDDLNIIWKVERLPGHGLIRFVKDRLLSFAMILGIGFLLLVSLVVSAGLAGFGQFVHDDATGSHILWTAINFAISLSMITVLFALIFKILPDVKIAWRNVWAGGFITALLFNLGKFLLGFYLGRGSVTSAYGAAGSLVILLLWVYYSSQILFFGAELTRVCSIRFGSKLEATPGSRLAADPLEKPRAKKTSARPHRHATA